ncbi:MAG: glycosyltransferase, partial [Verrucomicrobiota bacterium]|nr:glycosyltransferase [Verrucomicrobiota bacterium]
NLDNESSIKAFIYLLKLRPFHPEAYLQIIDISLEKNLLDQACYLIAKLKNLTPKWELVQNLYKSFNQRKHNNDNILTLLKKNCIESNRLTCCLITKNEEPSIGKCLKSVRKVANQIIVLDTGSEDNTKKIAATHGAEVYDHDWKDDFSEARNKCLEYARGDWVLFLDADEELTSDAVQTLKEDMAKPNILGYRLPLENVGSQLHGCNYVPRLVRNAPGLHFIGKIHETIHASVLVVMKQWNMEQVIGKTKILHHGYKPEALESKNKLQRNLELYEEALEELPDEPSIMMNYAHDLNHDGQKERAQQIYEDILKIFEQHKKEHITPEVREQFIHNYGVFLAQHLKMRELSEVMNSRTARETGPVANVHYMAGLGLMNCNKFREAIPELEASMEKAYDNTLAPCVPDVRTWKPKHLLANCHASVGNELKAIRLWEEVISECDDSPDPFHDYARFLSTLERNKEALEILLKGLKVQGDTRKIWELGCGVVNKDPELAEMSLEWTEEALKHHPDSDVTNVRRGESLMKNGRFSEAVEYFSRLSDRGEKTATAAQLVCRQLSDQAEEHDPEIARGFVNEVTGWIDVLDKAPCTFDRELAEQLIR